MDNQIRYGILIDGQLAGVEEDNVTLLWLKREDAAEDVRMANGIGKVVEVELTIKEVQ